MAEADNFVWCPSDCGSGQIHDSGNAQPIVTCLHCGHRSCFEHHVSWHKDLTCVEYDQLLADPENFRPKIVVDNEEWEERTRMQLEADKAMARTIVAEEQEAARLREQREREERDRQKKAVATAKKIALRRKREDEQTLATVNKTTKPCPGCGWAIEKNAGW